MGEKHLRSGNSRRRERQTLLELCVRDHRCVQPHAIILRIRPSASISLLQLLSPISPVGEDIIPQVRPVYRMTHRRNSREPETLQYSMGNPAHGSYDL
jgi:hypothetical protein